MLKADSEPEPSITITVQSEMKNGNISRLCKIGAMLLTVFALWGMSCCYRYKLHLHDYYYITRDMEFGEGCFLECNPGYPFRDGMSQIDNLKSVAWNSRLIVVEQQFPGSDTSNVWWIVPASGEELMCGNDTLLGPLTAMEKDAWLEAHSPTGRLKRRRY